jgi:kinesin family protein C1
MFPKSLVANCQQELSNIDKKHIEISAQLTAAQARNSALQSEVDRAMLAVSAMKAELATKQDEARRQVEDAEQRVQDALAERDARIAGVQAELRAGETIRRKLHNMVQELKGNIRVFARVRPPLGKYTPSPWVDIMANSAAHELNNPEGLASITYGDERLAAETGQSNLTVVSRSESAMGKEREQVNQFTFDKVFHPKHGQQDVFEEISMLAQSVLDGYNVSFQMFWELKLTTGLYLCIRPDWLGQVLDDGGWRCEL